MKRLLFTAALLGTLAIAGPTPVAAQESGGGSGLKALLGGGAQKDGEFLPVDQAFAFVAEARGSDTVVLQWEIADEYYLYRDKVKIVPVTPGTQFAPPAMPEGKTKQDEYFGEQVVYYHELVANVPVTARPADGAITFEVTYQGCADAGLCYPPTRKTATVTLAAMGTGAGLSPQGAPSSAPTGSKLGGLADLIRSGSLLVVIATFFGAGLLLAFTPCVLPMVPILSGIIVGAGQGQPVGRGRAFSLSVAYVLGMALTYTIAGAAFAAAGQQAQAFFQKPWLIVAFAALFVWLALGMFGLFNLQLPVALQSRLADLSNKQKQGTLVGTAVMGALSALIVTACVAPPLVAALAVISESGDVLRGALALFALSLGMGAPLLLVGASAGHLLPKAGPWMDAVKAVFGVMLLGVAVWMLGRILPGALTLALWAALAFVSGYCLMVLGPPEARGGLDAVRRGLGALAIVYGILLLIGALSGRDDPLQPLAGTSLSGGGTAAASHAAFRRVKSVVDLDRELAAARAAGKPVMLDFYADWCVSCKEMERYTFTDPGVQAEFSRAVLLQADVTANDEDDQALLRRFGILGPPSIVFFGPDGAERPDHRVVGFEPADEFRAHLAQAFATGGT